MSNNRNGMSLMGVAISGYLGFLVVGLLFWGAIIAVAWHFIAKFW